MINFEMRVNHPTMEVQMYLAMILLFFGTLSYGCASVPSQNSLQLLAEKLMGKSHAEIVQCAGEPVKQSNLGQGTVLRYYKEATMFEESWPFLKSSQPGVHHGCWASVLIENDRVTGIEFRTVPEETEKYGDECEEIFRACFS